VFFLTQLSKGTCIDGVTGVDDGMGSAFSWLGVEVGGRWGNGTWCFHGVLLQSHISKWVEWMHKEGYELRIVA